jgi:hypothetical protein
MRRHLAFVESWGFFAIIGISCWSWFSPTSTLNNRKDAKKVSKLEAQIPYHEGRGNKEEVEKIKNQIDAIWEKAKEAAMAV